MTLQDYLKLRNGTDVRGVASEGVEGESVTLTAEAAATIAKAFCLWLSRRLDKKKIRVAVGYDSRISSPALCEAVISGVLDMGHGVFMTGLSTTPSMYMLLKDDSLERRCYGSIMITASHLPFNRNGLKFFTEEGSLNASDVKEILTLASAGEFKRGHRGTLRELSYLDTYAAGLVKAVREATGEVTPLSGKKIIVDAGNGAGGFFTDKVLIPLGADTSGSQFFEPDGSFPNHIPNPENKEAMRSISEAVIKAKADFGIIFDTDVDRAGAVDKNGEEINRNRLIALLSAILLQEQAGTIVTDSVTSDGLTKFIEARGGKHHRFKRGYKNVINEAIRLNNEGEYTPLAMETSGHAALKENHFLDDGAYLITRLLIALAKAAKEGKDLTDLIAELETPVEEVEVRPCFIEGCDYKTLGRELLADFTAYAKASPYIRLAEPNYEGCRCNYDSFHGNGWALLRMSLHEPILPINVESEEKYGTFKILKDLYYFLKKYPYLNLAPLLQAIENCREELIDEIKQAANEERLPWIF